MISHIKNKTYFYPILLFFVSFISLYPITEMFFFRDDFMILYKMEQNLPFGDIYEPLLTFYKPVYAVFGLNASHYYWLGLILFSISAVFLYQFLLKISNKTVAFFATLLYATGLIALENLIMMVYVAPIPLLVITTSSFLILFLKFAETKKKIFYVMSLILYTFALIFFAYRAHLLYAYILFVDLFFVFAKEFSSTKKTKTVIHFIVRQLPYFLIYLKWFAPSGTTRASEKSSYYIGLLNLPDKENIIINFTNLFLQPINIIAPGLLALQNSQKIIVGLVILLFSVMIGAYAYMKGHKHYSLLLFFALSATLTNLIAYFFFNPDFRIQGISRYNFFNTISFNLYIVSLFLLIRNFVHNRLAKSATLIILFGIFILFLYASFSYIKKFNQTRSIQTKKFYSQLKKFMPAIPKGAIIYLDRKEILPFDPSELVRVGRLPTEGSFASMYKIPIENLTYTKSFDDVEKYYKNNPSNLNLVYAFFLHEDGLLDITKEVREGLASSKETPLNSRFWKSNPQESYIVDCGDYTVGIPPVVESQNLTIPSYTPIKLNLSISAKPLDLSSIHYPYYQIKGNLLNIEEYKSTSKEDLCSSVKEDSIQNSSKDIIQYSLFRRRIKELYQGTEISGTKTLPEDPITNLIDNDPRTIWTPDISKWAGVEKADIIMKFPYTITISKIFLSPSHPKRLPKAFSISTLSDDKNSWKELRKIKNAVMEENKWYEVIIPSTSTTSLKIEITGTNTGSYPQLSEIYVVENQFRDIDVNTINQLTELPFLYIPDKQTALELYSQTLKEFELAIFWKRDKDWSYSKNNYIKFPISPDGNFHQHSVVIPAGGTRLKKIRLEGFNLRSPIFELEVK